MQPEIFRLDVLSLSIRRQATAVRMFLGFFGFGILALEIGELESEHSYLSPSVGNLKIRAQIIYSETRYSTT